MSENQQFESDLLERLRAVAPQVPAEMMSVTSPPAQRVLAQVLATTQLDGVANLPQHPSRNSTDRTARRWPAWMKPRPVGAAAVLGGILAAAIVLVVAGGGGASIVARAYAATDPSGVIVHYVETSRAPSYAHVGPIVTQTWIYGQDIRQIFDANDPRHSQDTVISGGKLRTLTSGRLVIMPSGPANTKCAAAIVLEADCTAGGQNNNPISALRTLYRSGQIRVVGHAKTDGRRVDVLIGRSSNLRVRALIDARTFLPLHVTMTETFKGPSPVTYALTITGYQRLPVTTRNRQLLALPPHQGVRVIRFHPCQTKTNPHGLCSSTRSPA